MPVLDVVVSSAERAEVVTDPHCDSDLFPIPDADDDEKHQGHDVSDSSEAKPDLD